MPAKIDNRQAEQNFEFVDASDHADVQHSVIQGCARNNLHSATIAMSVPHRDQQGSTADITVRCSDFDVHWFGGKKCLDGSDQVSCGASQPCRHAVSTRIGLGIQPGTNHTAKRDFVVVFSDQSQIYLTNISFAV